MKVVIHGAAETHVIGRTRDVHGGKADAPVRVRGDVAAPCQQGRRVTGREGHKERGRTVRRICARGIRSLAYGVTAGACGRPASHKELKVWIRRTAVEWR